MAELDLPVTSDFTILNIFFCIFGYLLFYLNVFLHFGILMNSNNSDILLSLSCLQVLISFLHSILLSPLCYIFIIIFKYLKGRDTRRETSSICWVTLQKPPTARARAVPKYCGRPSCVSATAAGSWSTSGGTQFQALVYRMLVS